VQLLLLARQASPSPALPSYVPLDIHTSTGTSSVGTSSVVPLSFVALLILETALDVALADPSWTAGITLAHLVVLRWL